MVRLIRDAARRIRATHQIRDAACPIRVMRPIHGAVQPIHAVHRTRDAVSRLRMAARHLSAHRRVCYLIVVTDVPDCVPCQRFALARASPIMR